MKSEILNNLLIILTDFTINVIHSDGTTPRSKYEKKARIDVFYTTIFPWNERGFICNRFFYGFDENVVFLARWNLWAPLMTHNSYKHHLEMTNNLKWITSLIWQIFSAIKHPISANVFMLMIIMAFTRMYATDLPHILLTEHIM